MKTFLTLTIAVISGFIDALLNSKIKLPFPLMSAHTAPLQTQS